MTFQTLEYIIAIAEEHSMSRAADRLLISQPTLSRQLKRLEDRLETKLFVREHNEMRLTDAGKIYVNGARSIQNIHEHALSDIRKLSQSGKRQITLIYNNILLPNFSVDILPAFRKLHPHTLISTIDGNASIAKDYLSNGMADLAVAATGEAAHTMLEFLPLREEELMLALSVSHPLIPFFEQHGADLSQLSGESFILNQHNSFFRTLERNILSGLSFAPDILCEISDINAAGNMVAHQKGIAFLPRSAAGQLHGCRLFSLQPPVLFQIVIAYPKSSILTGPVRDLILLLLQDAESHINGVRTKSAAVF